MQEFAVSDMCLSVFFVSQKVCSDAVLGVILSFGPIL